MKYLGLITIFLLLLLSTVSQLAAQNPHGNINIDCVDCHSTDGWTVDKESMTFDHDRTGFPLLGEHRSVKCSSCHQTLVFLQTGTACVDCHTDVHRGQLGIECESCHTVRSWENRSEVFDKHNRTRFPLTGIHAITDCESCHFNQQRNEFASTPIDCNVCHIENFKAATNPNHTIANFDTRCVICHLQDAIGWKYTSFQHPSTFQLQGAHAKMDCNDCHVSSYEGTPNDCFSCHEGDYKSTDSPNHLLGNYPHDCLSCHNQSAWSPTSFDHNKTAFPLTGAHQTITCADCHVRGQYSGLETDCFSCHEPNYNGAGEPNHLQNNFDHECTQCHLTSAWEPSTFNHSQTGFLLTGAHVNVSCVDCHSTGYVETPIDCYSCHQSDYNGANDPNHAQNNFDHECTQCHLTSAWDPSTFNHSQTGFPLTGAHVNVSCVDCHSEGYVNTPTECFSCHESGYNEVNEPNHVQNSFDHDCTQCHLTSAWEPATFSHSQTRFQLTGAHVNVSCVDCHSEGCVNTPFDCFSCHRSDYNGANDPNHTQNNFDHDCTQCHLTSAWEPATFNHSQTRFPLTGAHANVGCVDCHGGGYANTPIDCYFCHESDYNNTTDPRHKSAGFPLQCENCHTVGAWQPANWDHDGRYFPIYSGSHRGEWNTCIDCHINPNDYSRFECINCHEHRKSRMDAVHKNEVRNYVYASDACYSCHRRGRADD